MKGERFRKAAGANPSASIADSRAAEVIPATPGGSVDRGPVNERLRGAVLVPVELIDLDPDQPRKEFDPEALEALASSLKNQGQLQPVLVRRSPTPGRWVVVVGERRLRAARMAGITKLQCVERETKDPESTLTDQLVENCLREDLRPVEQARAFRSLMERLGLSQRSLADRLSISQAKISQALGLLELPAEVQDAVEQGVVGAGTAAELLKVRDPGERKGLEELAVRGGLTREEVKRASRPRGPSRETSGSRRTFHHESGTVVVNLREEQGDLAVLRVLEDVAARLRSSTRVA